MLRLFTEALGSFLTDRLSGLPEKPVVSFTLPGQVQGRNAVSVFLSAMTEDGDLRSNEIEYESTEYGWIARKPPISLKCTYIISAWSDAGNPNEAALIQAELLSAAYGVFSLAGGALPDAYVPAPMQTSGLPKPKLVLGKDNLHNLPEFWTSAGCTFHTAFSLSATIHIPVIEEHYEHIVEGVHTDTRVRF